MVCLAVLADVLGSSIFDAKRMGLSFSSAGLHPDDRCIVCRHDQGLAQVWNHPVSEEPDRPWDDGKFVLGLTGGIGCGKSTLLQLFADRGWETVSADVIVGDLLATDDGISKAIGKEFGGGALSPEGGVDKRELGTLVFSDSSKLNEQTLEMSFVI